MRKIDSKWHEDLIEVGNNVYIIRSVKDPNYIDDYIYRVKMDNGQSVEMEIFPEAFTYESNKKIWTVILKIPTKKKKGYEYLKQTGKLGITGLLIAKNILKYHIENVIKKEKYYDHVIAISADNGIRMNVYERGLKDLGFEMKENVSLEKINYGKMLIKRIEICKK